jgi:hypothetical protein
MHISKLGRILGAACLAGTFVLAASGAASAAKPAGWTMTAVPTPSVVHNGANAGYVVTISNSGPSNIAALYLDTADSPTYVSGPAGACSTPGVPLHCSFGALTAGSSVTVTVAYATPSSGTKFSEQFLSNTTGATTSDQGGDSHGDNKTATGSTTLTTDKNFAGGFAIDRESVGTDTSLGNKNVQATSVTPPESGVVATVQDGSGAGTFTCTGCTKTLFGEWSKVTVNGGLPSTTLFPVTLLVYGKSLPKDATVDTIDLVHVLDNGTTEILSTRCGTDPSPNCVTVTPVGSTFRITGWVYQNGGFKGMG